MRRIVIALMGTLSGLALLFSYHTSTDRQAGSTGTTAGTSTGTNTGTSASSGSYTGDAVSTRWGIVQVKITVSGGKIVAADAVQVPNGNSRDVEINDAAVPILDQSVISAQSASFDGVSGATVTSDGYKQSLQSALDQAHL